MTDFWIVATGLAVLLVVALWPQAADNSFPPVPGSFSSETMETPPPPAFDHLTTLTDLSGLPAETPTCYDCNVFAFTQISQGKVESNIGEFTDQVDENSGQQFNYSDHSDYVIGIGPVVEHTDGSTTYSWLMKPPVEIKTASCETGSAVNRTFNFAEVRLPTAAERAKGAGLVAECSLPQGTLFYAMQVAGVVKTLPVPKNLGITVISD